MFIISFFFTATATTEIYTLSLHDALPIYHPPDHPPDRRPDPRPNRPPDGLPDDGFSTEDPPPVRRRPSPVDRSEEHTSELQSQSNLVCRLLLEKKKKKKINTQYIIHLTQI